MSLPPAGEIFPDTFQAPSRFFFELRRAKAIRTARMERETKIRGPRGVEIDGWSATRENFLEEVVPRFSAKCKSVLLADAGVTSNTLCPVARLELLFRQVESRSSPRSGYELNRSFARVHPGKTLIADESSFLIAFWKFR